MKENRLNFAFMLENDLVESKNHLYFYCRAPIFPRVMPVGCSTFSSLEIFMHLKLKLSIFGSSFGLSANDGQVSDYAD